jgi:endo-1,4-beta-xylanase
MLEAGHSMNYSLARHLLAVAALSLCGSALEAQSLRQQADTLGISIGAAVRPSLFSERLYAATLGREFNMVEPEDAMKWAVIRRERSTFDFTEGDQVIAFAQVHRMKVRGHTLVWGWSNPAWLTSPSFTPEELSSILQEHIATVVTHFRGKVFAWDVVNEAFDEHGALKHSPFYDQPGIGLAGKSSAYIEQALRWAHAADPQALLFYNDNGAETINVKSDAIYAMVKDFHQRGVPIDGIGMQMHIFDLHPDIDGIAANIARFAALGLQVHITEMDVALPLDASSQASAADLAQQAEIYRRIAAACLAQRNCTAIQTWGFTDKYSWIGWKSKGSQGQALPFDRNYRPKAAYGGLRDALNSGQKPASASAR